MRTGPFCLDGFFAASNTLEDAHPVLQMFKSMNIHKVCGGTTVLRDEDGILILVKGREDSAGLSLERGDEFCFHK